MCHSLRTLQFTVRLGTQSMVSQCPPPDAPWESVLLESSCDGGVHWDLIRELLPENFHKPRYVKKNVFVYYSGYSCT